MTDAEARAAVIRAYNVKYGDGTNIVIESLVPSPSGMILAVVKGAGTGREFDELCLVGKNGDVRIFDGTGDLAYNVARLNADRLTPFSPNVVAAVAFMVTLIAVIAFTWLDKVDEQGLQALTGILGLAAGFFFGNQTAKT